MDETDVMSEQDENAEVTAASEAEQATTTESENAEESSTSEKENSGETIEDDAPAEPKKNKVQKRIDELTAKRIEAERERDYYRSLVDSGGEKREPITQPIKPTLESCGYDDDKFSQAMDDYADKKAEWNVQQQKAQAAERQKQIEAQKRDWDYQSKSAQFAQSNPDYFSTVSDPNLRITNDMASVIKESDRGPELAYYLGKNPGIAAEIAALPAHRQYMELGKIEHEIATRKPPEKKISNAPPPVKPIGTNATATKDPAQMTDREFAEWRRGQIKRRS